METIHWRNITEDMRVEHVKEATTSHYEAILPNGERKTVFWNSDNPKVKDETEAQRFLTNKIHNIKLVPLVEWLNCTEELKKMGFSMEEIRKALEDSKLTLDDLTDTVRYEKEKPYHQTPYELVQDWHAWTVKRYETFKGHQWEREEQAQVRAFRVRGQYQGLKHGKLLHHLLKNRFEWLDEFKFEMYEIHNSGWNDIYLKTSEKHQSFEGVGLSLMVPIESMLKLNTEAIKKHNVEYWQGYTNSSYQLNKRQGETPDQFNARKKVELAGYLNVFAAKEVKALFNRLEQERMK